MSQINLLINLITSKEFYFLFKLFLETYNFNFQVNYIVVFYFINKAKVIDTYLFSYFIPLF